MISITGYSILFLAAITFFYAAFLPIYLEKKNSSPSPHGPPVLLIFCLYMGVAAGLFRLGMGNGFDSFVANIATVIAGMILTIIPTYCFSAKFLEVKSTNST